MLNDSIPRAANYHNWTFIISFLDDQNADGTFIIELGTAWNPGDHHFVLDYTSFNSYSHKNNGNTALTGLFNC